MSTPPQTPSDGPASRVLEVDLLALDLDTCGRCTGTDANLETALDFVREALRDDGVEVRLRRTVVRTAEQAEALRFESSPTIRVNGRDIALVSRESTCRDCGDLCGCPDDVTCRVWVWHGKEYLEAPTAMIVEALLLAHREGAAPPTPPAGPFRLPDNLRRFFEARDRAAASPSPCCPPRSDGCCSPDR